MLSRHPLAMNTKIHFSNEFSPHWWQESFDGDSFVSQSRFEVYAHSAAIETSRHLSTRVREHLLTDKNSNIFKHLRSSNKCKMACDEDCFTILDSANTYHHLKIKEALHIMWEKPILNKQVQHFDVLLNF